MPHSQNYLRKWDLNYSQRRFTLKIKMVFKDGLFLMKRIAFKGSLFFIKQHTAKGVFYIKEGILTGGCECQLKRTI